MRNNTFRDTRAQPVVNGYERSVVLSVKTGSYTGPSQSRGFAVGPESTGYAELQNENGIAYMRAMRPADDTAATWRYFWAGFVQANRFKSGQKITVLVRARASISTPLSLRFCDGNIQNQTSTNINATLDTMWQWLRYDLTMVADGQSTNIGYFAYPAAMTADSWVDIGEMMIVEGVYDGPYSDGNTPGWAWLGTANQSESAGYPYMLESIAGRPVLHIAGANQTVATSNAGAAVSGVSVYTTFNGLDTASAEGVYRPGTGMNVNIANAGPTVGGVELKVMGSPAGVGAIGVQAGVYAKGGIRYSRDLTIQARKGVHAIILPATMDTFDYWKGNTNVQTVNLPAAIAMDYASGALTNDLVTWPWGKFTSLVIYDKPHDSATRQKVMQWLANKYSVPQP